LSFVIIVRFLVVEFQFALPDDLVDYVAQIPLFDGSAGLSLNGEHNILVVKRDEAIRMASKYDVSHSSLGEKFS
jgi:hypothetical protein